MTLPGWHSTSDRWRTPLPGWPRPSPPPDYDAINAQRQQRSITVSLNGFSATNMQTAGTREQVSLEELSGWWDPAGDTTESVQHPQGDGDVSFRLRQGSRRITIAGLIETDYMNRDAERLLTLMGEVRAQTRSGVLRVEEHLRGMSREVDVRRDSLQMSPLGHAHAVFTMVLVADDPLLYGSASQTLPRGVQTMVRNAGDARVNPIIEWSGAATNPGVSYGGLEWRLGRNTASGDQVLVDCRNGDVFLNGSRIFPTWSGYWPYIPAGSNWGFTPHGATMTFRRKSAWS